MDQELKNHFDEIILKAVQSGKKETSGLVNDILRKQDKYIGEAIEKHVNGKIRALTQELKDHRAEDTVWKQEDRQWKENAFPIIEMGKNMQGFGKVTLYLVGFAASIGGLFLMLKEFIKK